MAEALTVTARALDRRLESHHDDTTRTWGASDIAMATNLAVVPVHLGCIATASRARLAIALEVRLAIASEDHPVARSLKISVPFRLSRASLL